MRLFIVGCGVSAHVMFQGDSPVRAGDVPAHEALAAWRAWSAREKDAEPSAQAPRFSPFWGGEDVIWVATDRFDPLWPKKMGPFFGPERSVGGVPRELGRAVDAAVREAHEKTVASLAEQGCRIAPSEHSPIPHNSWWAEPAIQLAPGVEALPDRVHFALPEVHLLALTHRGDSFQDHKERSMREVDRFFARLSAELAVSLGGQAQLPFTEKDVEVDSLRQGPQSEIMRQRRGWITQSVSGRGAEGRHESPREMAEIMAPIARQWEALQLTRHIAGAASASALAKKNRL